MADAGMAISLTLTDLSLITCGRLRISQATSPERLGAGTSASAPAGDQLMPSGPRLTRGVSMPRGGRGVAFAGQWDSTGSGWQLGGQGYT